MVCRDGLVVLGRIEGQLAQDLAGGGVEHGDLQVFDEQSDVGSGVGSAESDVVQSAVVAQGDVAGFADAVGADPVVGVAAAVGAGGGLGAGGVGRGGGGAVGQGSVWPLAVVLVAEPVE